MKIRPPTELEKIRLRKNNPAFSSSSEPIACQIAVIPDTDSIVGALTVYSPPKWQADQQKGRLQWHLSIEDNDFIIRGKLLDALLKQSSNWQFNKVAFSNIRKDSPEENFLMHRGFSEISRQEFITLDVDTAADRYQKALERQMQAGRIPAEIKIGWLEPRWIPTIRKMVLNIGLIEPDDMENNFHSSTNGYAPELSPQLVFKEKLIGTFLSWQTKSDALVIDAHVIDANYRSGWSHLVMTEALTQTAQNSGMKRYSFRCNPDEAQRQRNNAKRLGTPFEEEVFLQMGMSLA